MLPPEESSTMSLQALASDLWMADSPHRMLGLHLGTRMTIVRLPDRKLWLHSPISLSPELIAEISGLGEVGHIVCPNAFHHMYAGAAREAFPKAKLYGPQQLQKKRSDLRFDTTLSDTAPESWQGALQPITIPGSMLYETVFFHAASKTLISSDLIENFTHCEHGFTKAYLRLGGVLGKPGWHPLLRAVYFNRKAARASIDGILALPIERLIIAHGDIVETNAKQAIRDGLQWLLKA
jgi:hypothetical protein